MGSWPKAVATAWHPWVEASVQGSLITQAGQGPYFPEQLSWALPESACQNTAPSGRDAHLMSRIPSKGVLGRPHRLDEDKAGRETNTSVVQHDSIVAELVTESMDGLFSA